VHPQELLQRLERPRVDRQRATAALDARQRGERLPRVVVPEHLERQARVLNGVLDDQLGGRRVQADAQAQRARRSRTIQSRAREVGEQLRGIDRERKRRLALVRPRRERREPVGQLARERAEAELAGPARAARRHPSEPVAGDRPQPRADVLVHLELRPACDHVGDVGRDRVVLGDRPLLGVPVEAPAGDGAHRVDEIGAVREGEDDVRLAADLAQLDVRA
jgi:hypothetical protein